MSKVNKNISASRITRQEKQMVASLTVQTKQPKTHHGNAKALCWQYVGSLCLSESDKIETVDDTRIYCSAGW